MIGKADIIGFKEMERFFNEQQVAAAAAVIEMTEAAVDTSVQLAHVSVQTGIDLSETAAHAGVVLTKEVLKMQKKAVDYLYSSQPNMNAAEGIRIMRAALLPFSSDTKAA